MDSERRPDPMIEAGVVPERDNATVLHELLSACGGAGLDVVAFVMLFPQPALRHMWLVLASSRDPENAHMPWGVCEFNAHFRTLSGYTWSSDYAGGITGFLRRYSRLREGA